MSLHISNLIGFGASAAGGVVPSFISASTGTTNTAADTLAINYPSSIQAGDFIVCAVIGEDANGTTLGDTSIASLTNFSTGFDSVIQGPTGKYSTAVYYKIATGSESGTETATMTNVGGPRSMSGIMYLLRGGQTTGTPIENGSSSDNAASSTWNQRSIATAAAARLAMHVLMSPTSTTTASFTGESSGDFTEANTYASGNATIQLQTAGAPNAVTISGGSMTAGASARYTQTVAALKPAA